MMEEAGQKVTRFRSAQWYAGTDRNAYIHRAWMRRGLPRHAFDGRPHIAIANTASDLTPCNAHLDEVADSVKEGVWEAGGVPLNLPVVSLGETQVRPTAVCSSRPTSPAGSPSSGWSRSAAPEPTSPAGRSTTPS
jgi:dihydroxyacid dehydratase/phosphogluconate dehydratase